MQNNMIDQAVYIGAEIQKTALANLERDKIIAQTEKARAEAAKAGRVSEEGRKGVVLPAGGRVVDPVTGRIIAEGVP